MENNDSNIKSQQTGGLKLMTVFIAVLALHVVVIGGFTVYHLMSGGSTDADLTSTDKTHKPADGTTADTTPADKSAPSTQTTTPPTEVATIPANTSTPEPDAAAPTVTTTPASTTTPAPTAPVVATPAPVAAPVLTPPPALTLNTNPQPAPITTPAEVVDEGAQTPSGPISAAPTLAPTDSIPTPSVPVASGPVHMPPVAASAPAHTHEQIYVVKITDSYKKIAHAHHITVAQLKEANHIRTDVLHSGQKLVIPSEKTVVATTTALDSSSNAAASTESNASGASVLASAPTTETTTTSRHHVYTVVKGDTLIKIAHRFKTTTSAIMAENSITDPTRLTIGKKLRIPSEESRSAKNNAPASTQPGQVQAKDAAPSAQLANFIP